MSEKNHVKINKILLAIDKSGYKDKATAYAITLAKSLSAEVTAVHVVGRSSLGASRDLLGYYRGGMLKGYQDALKKDAQKFLDKVVELGEKDGVTMHSEVLVGSPVKKVIVDYAKNQKVDLIIIGARGMAGMEKFVLGGIAHAVVSYAHCPVLAVR
jgi:nucleotide-binding universal stress UspA family protein